MSSRHQSTVVLVASCMIGTCAAQSQSEITVTPTVAFTVSSHQFLDDVTDRIYGPIILYGGTAGLRLNDHVEPFIRLQMGGISKTYPERLMVTFGDLGFRLNLTPYRAVSLHLGASICMLLQERRVYFSPCLPGNEGVYQRHASALGYQVLGGPEIPLYRQRLHLAVELTYTADRGDYEGSTATPEAVELGGWGVSAALRWWFGRPEVPSGPVTEGGR